MENKGISILNMRNRKAVGRGPWKTLVVGKEKPTDMRKP